MEKIQSTTYEKNVSSTKTPHPKNAIQTKTAHEVENIISAGYYMGESSDNSEMRSYDWIA